jgi:hypothetical protein
MFGDPVFLCRERRIDPDTELPSPERFTSERLSRTAITDSNLLYTAAENLMKILDNYRAPLIIVNKHSERILMRQNPNQFKVLELYHLSPRAH